MTYIFGIDPGADHKKHSVSERGTGWALIEVHDNVNTPPTLAASGHVLGGPDSLLAELVKPGNVLQQQWAMRSCFLLASIVVVENFKLFDKNADPAPLEIIGMMKLYCALESKEIVVQMPGERGGVTHDDLKRIGMWPGGRGHADTAQAIRHILSWLMKKRHKPTMMLVSPPPED